jgi:hypothetical protein
MFGAAARAEKAGSTDPVVSEAELYGIQEAKAQLKVAAKGRSSG